MLFGKGNSESISVVEFDMTKGVNASEFDTLKTRLAVVKPNFNPAQQIQDDIAASWENLEQEMAAETAGVEAKEQGEIKVCLVPPALAAVVQNIEEKDQQALDCALVRSFTPAYDNSEFDPSKKLG